MVSRFGGRAVSSSEDFDCWKRREVRRLREMSLRLKEVLRRRFEFAVVWDRLSRKSRLACIRRLAKLFCSAIVSSGVG